ncbi:hypothetical protein [Leptospira sp. 'Mane']|uniref:hypothetical protein n=1 Tax=Leptospira sp. 'Mane' TaxID=3387407 RepID=UPI00398B0A09
MPKKKMAYWDIELNGKPFNEIKRFVSSISVEYEINKLTQASIQIESVSFLENYFSMNQKLTIKMGWDGLGLIDMFEGEIEKNPEGNASDFLSYTIPLLDSSVSMARREKNMTFPSNKKSDIIKTIAGANGYDVETNIKDASCIKGMETPIQKYKTDFEFLEECATKWNCLFWVDPSVKKIYFMDSDIAHKQGDVIHASSKFRSMDDQSGEYKLGYKTDYAPNNISNLNWKFGTPRNANPGTNIVNRTGEKGKVVSPEDFVTEFYGKTYKYSPEVVKKMKTDPSFSNKVMEESSTKTIEPSEITKYYVAYPADGESKTNKHLQVSPHHRINAVSLDVDLNIGDPYLRPPRQVKLFCGSLNPRALTSNLPNWLVNSGSEGRLFYLNKVKHELTDGMIKTNLELSL